MQWEAGLWKGPHWQDWFLFVGSNVVVVCTGNVRGRHVTAFLLFWTIGCFVGKDGVHPRGDMV